jgi:drug/metabolite transporter (DMT)-like permease
MPSSPGRSGRPPIFSTARGSQPGAFGPVEWALLTGIALIWGSSYLLIDIGLDSLAPAVVTWVRLALGFLVLAGFPAARRPVDRADWRRITALALVWTSFPFLLSPISQQHIDSALAGMINSLIPIFAASIAMVFLRTLPGARQVAGLLLGLVGAISLGLPAASESPAAAWGVFLAVVAAGFYGLGLTLAVPLQQRYGAPAVLMRTLGVSAVLVAPFAIAGLGGSAWEAGSVVAVTVLGIVNTGVGFLFMVLFAGRVGPTRGGVAIYFLPIVAILLGTAFRSEVVLPIQWIGTAVVLVGAWLTSRRET